MARIAGVDLPRSKRICISLTYIFGIGRKTAEQVLREGNISLDKRTQDLSDDELNIIRKLIEKLTVESDLKRFVSSNIKRVMDLGCYVGLRHRRGLPVRGQLTKTNSRTRKGPKKTVANKKK